MPPSSIPPLLLLLLPLLFLLLRQAPTTHAFAIRSSSGSKGRPTTMIGRHHRRLLGSTLRRPSLQLRSTSSAAGGGETTAGDTASAQAQPQSPLAQAAATFARVFPPGTSDSGVDHRPVVLFDGVCAFCNRGIDAVLRLDVNRRLRFAPLQSEVGRHLMEVCGRDPDDLSSMCVIEADKRLSLKSDAAIRIAEVAAPHPALGGAFERAARLLLPQGLRDSAYDTVADNRYSILGKRETCRLPDPGDDRFLA